jgi:hypothetical protein
VWVDISERSIGPDVKVLRGEGASAHRGKTEIDPGGAVAVATRSQPVVVTVPHDEWRESFVQIFQLVGHSLRDNEKLVIQVVNLELETERPGNGTREGKLPEWCKRL